MLVGELSIMFKKTLIAREQDPSAVAGPRAQWRKYQGGITAARLIFIDETGAQRHMTR